MGSQDARFDGEIFRQDNPIILACRRDKAVLIGARIIYNSDGYMPGQALARKTSDGLFYKWSAISGGTYDTPCVLFDKMDDDAQLADGGGLGGVSGASLVRAVVEGIVYTGLLLEADAAFKTAIKSVALVDAGGVAMTKI
jgi:hypothetical protein